MVQSQGGPHLWMAAECWPLAQAADPLSVAVPPVSLPEALAGERSAAEAWVEWVRGRLSCTGPVTASKLATDLGLPRSHVQIALEALEAEGFALRGRFTHSDGEIEWCERRLLARIHRLTLDNLRRQIQPVEPHDFMRFLIEHQHLSPATRLPGERGLAEIIAQLQGFEIPAAAWEREILSRRLENYDPAWLDHLSLAGEVAWGRLHSPRKSEDIPTNRNTLSRVVPFSLVLRQELSWLLPNSGEQNDNHIRSNARLVLEMLANHGASFFDDLLTITKLPPAQLGEAISELVALGLVTADGFAALRALVLRHRRSISRAELDWPRRNGNSIRPYSHGGRWTLFPQRMVPPESVDRIERWAWQLLSRYGIMFRDLLARESVAPPWKVLLPVYRRLEARGEIRGGRFVDGVAGEQFATSEAVDRLRRIRDRKPDDAWLVISACDPVNLFGLVTKDSRVPALRTNLLVVRDGRLIASRQSGEIQFHEEVGRELAEEMTRTLKNAALPGRYQETSVERKRESSRK
jgi:ATP-dependent Lhr-like helicase